MSPTMIVLDNFGHFTEKIWKIWKNVIFLCKFDYILGKNNQFFYITKLKKRKKKRKSRDQTYWIKDGLSSLQSRSGVGLPSYIQPKFEDFVDNQGLHNNVAFAIYMKKASY